MGEQTKICSLFYCFIYIIKLFIVMRLILLDKRELEMGIEKESTEHGMSYEEARRTAIDHLKERPDYYSVAEKAGLEEEGLEEWTDSIFTKEKTGGRTGRLKKHWNKQKRSGKKQFADIPVGASGGMFTDE